MDTIWKFPLKVTDHQVVRAPASWDPLSVQMQEGVPTIWAKVRSKAALIDRHIWVVGTGNRLHPEADGTFIGTVQMESPFGGTLVWHVFEGSAP